MCRDKKSRKKKEKHGQGEEDHRDAGQVNRREAEGRPAKSTQISAGESAFVQFIWSSSHSTGARAIQWCNSLYTDSQRHLLVLGHHQGVGI